MHGLTFPAQLSLDFIFGGIDTLPNLGEEVMSEKFEIQLGGGSLVYAIVLSRLGVPCRVLAKKSDSLHAEIAHKILESYNIAEIDIEKVEGYDTIMSTAVISMKADRSFVSKNDDRAVTFSDDYLTEKYKDSKIVFATTHNINILPEIKKNGSITIFDVGWSDDLSIEKYQNVLQYVDYFTPNDKEAMKMTGAPNVEESLKILSKYVKHPIISCGKDGCLTIDGDEIIHVGIPAGIKSVDTTGAGDNFMAGLIYGLYNDMPLIECIKIANCTGALSTTGLGCYGVNYTLEDVMLLRSTYDV